MLKRGLICFIILSAVFLTLLIAFDREGSRIFKGPLHPPGEEDENAIRSTITVYNKIYQDLFVTNGVPAMLNNFPASKQLRHEVFRHIGYLRGKGLVLILDNATEEVLDIKWTEPGRAEATVFEEWNYLYRYIKGRQPARALKGMGAGYRYVLEKRPEGWVVVEYFPVDIVLERDNEFLF